MNKKRQAFTLLLQAREYKKQLSVGYKYDSSLSREANMVLQNKWKDDISKKLGEATKKAKTLIEEIKKEEQVSVQNKSQPKYVPTGNVYEQVASFKK